MPLIVDGKREIKEFKSKDDVWDVIELLIKEVHENNELGNAFDLSSSINSQIPFFACCNIIFDRAIQKDIQRYIYCTQTGVSPYKGDYGDQPALWVDRFFIIKGAIAKNEKRIIDANSK